MGKSRHVNAASGLGHLAYGKKLPRVFDMALVRVPGTTLPMISPGSPSAVVRLLYTFFCPHFIAFDSQYPANQLYYCNILGLLYYQLQLLT